MSFLTGSVYIGVAEGDMEYGECRDTIERIWKRPGDEGPKYHRATKGYEGRQKHIASFMASKHDAILLLDGDMYYPPDILERLRSHGLPFVSGLYMRRNFGPIAPVWFEPWAGQWPYTPWLKPIERGRLHPIGASGWGCMFIRREVIEATRPLLKGEAEVIEDDMDVWPMDLPAVFGALRGMRGALGQYRSQFAPADMERHLSTLEREIRPIRASKHDCIGSDIRFPWYALQAGYQLYGDPDAACGHNLHYPLSADDYAGQMADASPASIARLQSEQARAMAEETARVRRNLEACGG